MAVEYRRTIIAGETLSWNAQWVDSTGTGINLTGYTAALRAAATYGGSALFSIATGSGITVDSSGNVTSTIAAGTTAGWTPGDYVYDLFVTSAGGIATCLERGIVTVKSKA